ncbi:hypothetical protein J4211_01310 [Candidatus Woesearchaeota archaeon]|nr:hypothetical protein [Candidatus Woesearchaeota archaeon]
MELRVALAGIIFILLLTGAMVQFGGTPTGAVVKENSYALTLDDTVNRFFETYAVTFPQGSCGEVARQLYEQIALPALDTSDGFATQGPERLATINFVVKRTSHFGTLDMSKGKTLNGNEGGFLSINTETLVRVPKDQRSTYYFMDLYGIPQGTFIITKGSFSTPSVDCTFNNIQGRAVCNCSTHPISAIRSAGITTIRPARQSL